MVQDSIRNATDREETSEGFGVKESPMIKTVYLSGNF